MKWGRVNTPVADVCNGSQIRVAYNNLRGVFWVMDNNKMFQYQYDGSQFINHMTFPHEILSTFFIANQLSPTFLDNPNLVREHFYLFFLLGILFNPNIDGVLDQPLLGGGGQNLLQR